MVYHSHHRHNIFLSYFKNKELDELYFSVFLKAFAESMISIFIPIYLVQHGFSIPNVALYYLIFFLSVGILMPMAMISCSMFGIKVNMIFGTLVLIAFYFLITKIYEFNPYLVSIVYGISVSFYFAGFHIEFKNASKRKKEGESYSLIKIFTIVAASIGPLIGAILISRLSFNIAYLAASIILFISSIPLLMSSDLKPKRNITIKNVYHSDSNRKAIVYQTDGALMLLSLVFWPLFIYLSLKSVLNLGIIVSISSLLVLVLLFVVTKHSDKHNKQVFRSGVVTNSIGWISKILLIAPIGFFVSHLIDTASRSIIEVSFNKLVYAKAKKRDIINYFLYREFNLEIGRIIILLIIIFTDNLIWVFTIAFFLSFLYYLVK